MTQSVEPGSSRGVCGAHMGSPLERGVDGARHPAPAPPRNPFTEAAGYALAREKELRVFLQYPDVPIDTNHLERQIRPIALGRKNWLFCRTEIGAKYVGIFQSLLVTCRLQGVDPYVYLVDVLQRVERHPARHVAMLTPRLWKEHFAAAPLRSPIDRAVKNAVA